jgi:hypothetical protein
MRGALRKSTARWRRLYAVFAFHYGERQLERLMPRLANVFGKPNTTINLDVLGALMTTSIALLILPIRILLIRCSLWGMQRVSRPHARARSNLRSNIMLRNIGLTLAIVALSPPAHADVDELGAFQTEFRVEVPEYHGLEPRITLAYDSSLGNGLLGVGWRLQAGSLITRVSPRRGVPRFDSSDIYLLDGGELVACVTPSDSPSCTTAASAVGAGIVPGTAVFYSTRVESYQRIAFDPPSGTWSVWSKTGTTATYRSLDGGRTFSLSSLKDTHGNLVTYNTWCDGANHCYLDRITYAGSGAAAGAEIRFFLAARPDPIEAGVGAVYELMAYRLKSISVKWDGQLTRAYALNYALSASTGASLLRSFQMFGRDASLDTDGTLTAGPTPPLPLVTFEAPSMGRTGDWEFPWITTQPNLTIPDPLSGAVNYPSHYGGRRLPSQACDTEEFECPWGLVSGDWNGDGRSDLLYWAINRASCETLSLTAVLTEPVGASSEIGSTLPTGVRRSGNVRCAIAVWVGDFNGDARDDLLLLVNGRPRIAYSLGSGRFSLATGSTNSRTDGSHCDIGDVDADGKADLVCSDATNSTPQLITFRTQSDGSFAITSELLSPQLVTSMEGHRLVLADVNGDGRADVVLATQVNGTWMLVTGLSRGDGTWDWEPGQTTPWAYAANESARLFAGDFDGDGRKDVLLDREFNSGGPDEIYVGLSLKGALGGRFLLVNPATPWARRIAVADVNGDGKDDLILRDTLTAAFANGTGWFEPPPSGSNRTCAASCYSGTSMVTAKPILFVQLTRVASYYSKITFPRTKESTCIAGCPQT